MKYNFVDLDFTGEKKEKKLNKIPFALYEQDDIIQSYKSPVDLLKEVVINEKFDYLYFLGLTTANPEGSEWWGQAERYYSFEQRLFIGDRLGLINIIYDDGHMDVIELIMGVNVWPYELFSQVKEVEDLRTYGGPYPEPFSSDEKAADLLDNSLVLTENDELKECKYIMCVQVEPVGIDKIQLLHDSSRKAGFVVSAITGAENCAQVATEKIKPINNKFFIRKEYFPAMDKLSRRLYQYKDEIPEKIELDKPEDYERNLQIKFNGCSSAEIFTNVFYHNYHDMITKKVDRDGMTHTSSPDAPSFGNYVGFGTYALQGPYYNQIWTRDIGRSLIEACDFGERVRTKKAAERLLHDFLYDESLRYDQPNWKRIANASELGSEELLKSVSGKENDGHAAIMLFITKLFLEKVIDQNWLETNKKHLIDAANWFVWQIENPEKSNFDEVLYSESEASTGIHGGHDLFSNITAMYALKGFSLLAEALGDIDLNQQWKDKADVLYQGIMKNFVSNHPRYGKIFVDTIYDCWTWEYSRFSPLFIASDLYGYDLDNEFMELIRNTYQAQKEDYFSYAAGRQMGYGQGYITQTSILLDQFQDMSGYLEKAADFCYHHSDFNYIVPEGVIMHPSGRFWYRNCDLGNSVQQAEIIKCARLLLGLDGRANSDELNIIPRLPEGWESMMVENYKAVVLSEGDQITTLLDFKYQKNIDGQYSLYLKSDNLIDNVQLRIGPFSENTKDVKVSGISKKGILKEVAGYKFLYLKANQITELNIKVKSV